eukprot:12908162-Ditylum_brightwellii.AAC.1
MLMLDLYTAKIEECKEHVKMHKQQQDLANLYIQQAKKDTENGEAIEDATLCYTVDMAQNMGWPWLMGKQYGDFYYQMPETALIDGKAGNANGTMDAFVWSKAEANCGADNIILNLHWYLECKELFPQPHPPKHIVIICDNYPLQNKNFTIL